MFKIIANKDKKLCCAYRCKNKRTSKDRFCSKHRHRYNKEMNPLSYVFNTLRCNAKRRGKPFNLTLDEFKTFCQETGYLEKRGKNKKSASIDRIDNNKGYEIGNLQILTLSDNSSKWTHEEAPF